MNKDDIVMFDDLIDLLNENKILHNSITDLNKNVKDGRTTGLKCEDIICESIIKISDNAVVSRDSRDFYDIKIGQYYVNVKVVKGIGNNDNANCKLGMFIALTGREPDFENGIDHIEFLKKIRFGMDNPSANKDDIDYIFLVYFKNSKKFGWVGLKQIEKVTANGNNLPFQINYNSAIKNRNNSLSDKDNIEILLGGYKKSGKLRSTVDTGFDKYFSDGVYLQ